MLLFFFQDLNLLQLFCLLQRLLHLTQLIILHLQVQQSRYYLQILIALYLRQHQHLLKPHTQIKQQYQKESPYLFSLKNLQMQQHVLQNQKRLNDDRYIRYFYECVYDLLIVCLFHWLLLQVHTMLHDLFDNRNNHHRMVKKQRQHDRQLLIF